MKIDYEDIGKRIRAERKRRKWTQEELAEKADISTSFLGHVERGTRKASVETLCKIAYIFRVSLDSIITIAGDTEKYTHITIRRICDELYKAIYDMLAQNWPRDE